MLVLNENLPILAPADHTIDYTDAESWASEFRDSAQSLLTALLPS